MEILGTRGFLPQASIGSALAAESMLEAERSSQRTAIAAARERLAVEAGLGIDAAPLDADHTSILADLMLAPPEAAPSPQAIWDARPEVRAARLRHAVAGARLERVLADRFPELRLGLKAMTSPGEALIGPMLEAALAHPGALEGRIEAARQGCAETREGIEGELLAAVARARTAAEQWAEAHRLHAEIQRLERDTSASWEAARARFSNDPEALEGATAMLFERLRAIRMLHEHDRELASAALEFRRAAGISAGGAAPEARP
jgi:outer membrane protein TolC